MELFKNTTDLIGLKDNNITISFVLKHQTHIEIRAKLDYQAPACSFCRGNMIKYDFQKSSTIPILDVQGMPTLLKLKKRRFQCKNCRKVVVSQTSLVRKNHQISQPVWTKITQLLTESLSNAAIARQCHVSVATIQRQLENFQIKETFNKLPAILSWDEFSRNKGQLAFIAQDFETRQIVTVLEDNKQTTIKNFFYKFPRKVRETVKVVTVDMSGSYIPIIKKLFPNARIVLDRFHIIQHLSRAMMSTRIAIMKSFDTQSLPYRAMKNHWRILQKDSRKLSLETFYSRTFRQTLTPREVVQKTLPFSEELHFYYDLYQILLFHFKDYIINALELPYSNAKLEATNKLIKDIKRQAFGFKTFKNFKTTSFWIQDIQEL